MRDVKKCYHELIEQGADEETIKEAEIIMLRAIFKDIENARSVSIEEYKRMKAAGESTRNVLVNANDFMKALNAGEFD